MNGTSCHFDCQDFCSSDLTLFDSVDPYFPRHPNYHQNKYGLTVGGSIYEYSRLDPNSNVTCKQLEWGLSCKRVCNHKSVCHESSTKYCSFLKDVNDTKRVECIPKISILVSKSSDSWETIQDTYSKSLVASADRSEIKLQCDFTSESNFSWSINGERSMNEVKAWDDQKINVNLKKNENADQWKQFLNEGLKFTCFAKNTYPYPMSMNSTVTLKGIQTVNYGESQSFVCKRTNNETFIWKKDGKVVEGKKKGSETLTFKYSQPKRVFVECDNEDGINIAKYTMDVCAIEENQQNLRYFTMLMIPAIFTSLALFTLILPKIVKTSRTAEPLEIEPKERMGKNRTFTATNKATILLGMQLLLLPICSSFSFLLDVMTDYMAFFTYLLTGHPYFGLSTLALISFSSLITSTIAATNVFFNSKTSKDYERLTKTKFRRFLSYFFMYCNLGPILIQLQLLLTNFEIMKLTRLGKMIPYHLRMKQDRIVKLLMKLVISGLVCGSLGQGILQAYILSQRLGTDNICLPSPGAMQWNMTRNESNWLSPTEFTSYDTQSGETASGCTCDQWIAKGADHCYLSDFLGDRGSDLPDLSCYIADCSTSKYKFSVIFPFLQVISSILQISFALTHLGAVKNLHHLASLTSTLKKAFFYALTYIYFLTSLSTALVLSTYLAFNGYGLMQMLAFLSLLRLILPETTSARRYLAPWLVRVLSVLLPLIAYLPFYYLLYTEAEKASSCTELARNRITIHMRKDKTFGQDTAAYYATADQIEKTLIDYLRNMNLFPISLKDLVNDQEHKLPTSNDEAVFNIRNSFNVFGHFFLWTGWLVMADAIITTMFLLYWVFVVRSYQTIPNMNKLVDRMSGGMSLSFMNADSPAVFSATTAAIATDHNEASTIFS